MRPFLLFVLCVLPAVAGCGRNDRVGVSGTVTWNGAPLPEGEIIFSPAAGTRAPTVAGPILDGRFDIPARVGLVPSGVGLGAGKYRVEITADRPTGRKVQADEGSTEMADQFEQYIPPRYNEASTLTLEARKGMDDLVFELTDGGTPNR